MKTKLLIACIVCLSAICKAQEKGTGAREVKLTPPVIVKDQKLKAHSKEKTKFTPPTL